jgi:membrane protein YqaA with SNARE-associated domain
MAILASLIGGMILWRLGDKLRGKESKIWLKNQINK